MKTNIINRITSLREWMKRKKIAAFIVPSTDPHVSEYVSPHWKTREWISGFNGSAGTIVVTLQKAGLWTDSRYFLQAAEQLDGSGIDLYKEMLPDTPSITDFLCDNLPTESVIGIDGKIFSASGVEDMQRILSKKGLSIQTEFDPFDEIWEERPPMPQAPAFIYETCYAGKSCKEKVEIIRREMEKQECESLLLSALDEVAWTLNLRGSDVKCNPVIVSYLLITQSEAIYFIAPEKTSEQVRSYLQGQGIAIKRYDEIEKHLSFISSSNILLNPAKTNYSVFSSINPDCKVIKEVSPVALLKAIRNEQEIIGIHNAMKKDGVALVKFLMWLEEAIPTGCETELSVDEKLHNFRAQQDQYMGESFDTIAGYKAHGAIIHYSATPESSAKIEPIGFLLLDSGAQYMDGTTDITRTIALGYLTDEEKTDYTLVLKGHIALAMAKFPAGTRGAQLDVLARMPLWKLGMNYLYGTGHGVGHFLSVHEGPQSIRMNENPVVLQPGMLTSNEPGVYKPGSHGVRTENLILTVKGEKGMYDSDYLQFETVTLCPICTKGIIKDLLSPEEISWLNAYHQMVYEKLSGRLNAGEKGWLKEATQKI